jgi:hypothetical protein
MDLAAGADIGGQRNPSPSHAFGAGPFLSLRERFS